MVKQLMTSTHPDLLAALCSGQIRIHRAWKWSKQSPEKQIEALTLYRSKKGINKAIRDLISHQKSRRSPTVLDLAKLTQLFSAFDPDELDSVGVLVVKGSGKMVYLTEELAQTLGSQGEFTFACTTKNL
jgi:hypothetical protein